MVKRRGSRDLCAGHDGDAVTGKFYGGGGGKFGVFEFDDADLRAESESRKTLAKFCKSSPSRKASHHRQPAEKYYFLEKHACGSTMTPQNQSLQVIECNSSGAKSPAKGRRNSEAGTTGQKNNAVLYVHSDDDECMELRSLTPSSLGSLEEQSSDCGKYSTNNDCEAMVVLDPSYVKYGSKYYTRCRLIFSQRWIQLEGSPLCDRNMSYCVKWTDFKILDIQCQLFENAGANVVNLHMKANESENKKSGCVELEFDILNDPWWSKKQEEIKSLDLQYKSAWKIIKCDCYLNYSFEEIAYPEGDPDSVFISTADVELLQPKTFINDTLIDFYMKYLASKINPEERHRFYFFNTFFFRKLVDMHPNAYRTCSVGETFQRVRKWTRNVNLFEKDYLFMPIISSLHWSLLVICHLGEVANIGGSTNNSSNVPLILHMNSIRESHGGFEDLIKRYLQEEWQEQNLHVNYRDSSEESKQRLHQAYLKKIHNLDFVVPKLPQQENLFDCGLFLLHYAELFLEQVLNARTPAYSNFLNEGWFHPAEVSLKKRDQIRKLIYRIVENKALKSPAATCDDDYLHTIVANEGDTSAQSVHEISANESCHGVKLHSPDHCHEFTREQNNILFTTDERCQPCKQKQPIPISEFSNMCLPVKEVPERQNTFPPQDAANIHESNEDDKTAPPISPPCSINSRELKLSEESSEPYCIESPVTCYVMDEANHIPNVTYAAEEEEQQYEISSTSSDEDPADLIVEDSEEEIVFEGRDSRKSSFHSLIDLNMYGSP